MRRICRSYRSCIGKVVRSGCGASGSGRCPCAAGGFRCFRNSRSSTRRAALSRCLQYCAARSATVFEKSIVFAIVCLLFVWGRGCRNECLRVKILIKRRLQEGPGIKCMSIWMIVLCSAVKIAQRRGGGRSKCYMNVVAWAGCVNFCWYNYKFCHSLRLL